MTQRKHMKAMVDFAIHEDSLTFVKLGTVGETEFFILTEFPLWEDDKEYQVRNDMTLAEAKADRKETMEAFAEVQQAADTLAQY